MEMVRRVCTRRKLNDVVAVDTAASFHAGKCLRAGFVLDRPSGHHRDNR